MHFLFKTIFRIFESYLFYTWSIFKNKNMLIKRNYFMRDYFNLWCSFIIRQCLKHWNTSRHLVTDTFYIPILDIEIKHKSSQSDTYLLSIHLLSPPLQGRPAWTSRHHYPHFSYRGIKTPKNIKYWYRTL